MGATRLPLLLDNACFLRVARHPGGAEQSALVAPRGRCISHDYRWAATGYAVRYCCFSAPLTSRRLNGDLSVRSQFFPASKPVLFVRSLGAALFLATGRKLVWQCLRAWDEFHWTPLAVHEPAAWLVLP